MRRIALAATLVAGGLLAAPAAMSVGPSSAFADEKDDRKKDDKDEKKRKEEERRKKREAELRRREIELKAIGAEFAARNADALVARVPKDAKISLRMGGDDGEYARDQARGVLGKYFEKFETVTVTFSQAEESVGRFKMTVRKKGDDEAKPRTLYVTIEETTPGGAFALTKLAVDT